MKRKRKNLFLMDDNEIYAEAQRRIRECREKKGKKLDLSGLDLKEIPPEITDLETLTVINLECPLVKKLPESFCKLKKMEAFRFRSCNLTAIPDFITGWAELKELEIEMQNTFQGPYTNLVSIPKNIGNLKKLKTLKLNGTSISKIPDSLSECPLEYLHIIGNFKTLPDSIGNCKNLKIIIIDSDKLTFLPQSFCNLKKLEELHLEAFNLKSLPAAFGRLSALKTVDIFSGVLVTLPESMGNLKKLKTFFLDIHNVKELPSSFKKLSYVENYHIQTRKKEHEVYRYKSSQKKRKTAGFREFVDMSYNYRRKVLDAYSIKKFESILCSARFNDIEWDGERDVSKDIMLKRRNRLNWKFKWTEENIKRIVKVSDEFLKAWEDGYNKAILLLKALYEQEQDKASFKTNYSAEITLYPQILFDDNDDYKPIYDFITSSDYLRPDIDLNMSVRYDPENIDKDNFNENIFVSRDLSWNIEGFGDIELKDHYICNAIHVLYSHNEWANEDILKINNILTEVKVNCNGADF